MGNKEFQVLRLAMLFTDFILMNFAALTSIIIWYKDLRQLSVLPYIASINASWFIIAFFLKLYTYESVSSLEITYRQSWRILLLQTAFLYFVVYFFFTISFANQLVISYVAAAAILFLISRFFQTYIVEFFLKKFSLAKVSDKIVIVGDDHNARQLAEYFQRNKNIYQFFGFFTDANKVNQSAGEKSFYPVEECINYALRNNVKEIYSTVLPHENPQVTELVKKADANFVRVRFVASEFMNLDSAYEWIQVDRLNQLPVMALRMEPLNGIFNRVKKRCFDLLVSSLIILFIMSWLTPLLAIIIKLTSRGPVFFVQYRSGKNNNPFYCFKFRSMHVNSESDEKQASKHDTRITKIGAFMRATSLDEFPQFFNVFMGDMSICGPRPHMLKHTEEYSKIINKYMVRHFLKPGVTGWAQVNGYRGEIENPKLMEKRVEHDIWYMENWSLMLDIRIIFLTIFNVLKGEENAR